MKQSLISTQQEEKPQQSDSNEEQFPTKTSNSFCSSGAISAPQPNIITFQYPGSTGKQSRATTTQATDDGCRLDASSQHLDFIGPSAAVKDIFGLPYSGDVGVAIAVHNLGNGTLLIDGAVVQDEASMMMNMATRKPSVVKRKRPRPTPAAATTSTSGSSSSSRGGHTEMSGRGMTSYCEETNLKNMARFFPSSWSQEARSSLGDECVEAYPKSDDNQERLLQHISHMIQMQKKYLSMTPQESSDAVSNPGQPVMTETDFAGLENQSNDDPCENLEHILPAPEEYTNHVVSIGDNHRFYQPWKFHKYRMLVGSDAIVLRSKEKEAAACYDDTTTSKQTFDNDRLTLRIVDCDVLKSTLNQREEQKSYAEVLCRRNEEPLVAVPSKQLVEKVEHAMVPYPDFARHSLQSCVLPSPDFQHKLHQYGFSARPFGMNGGNDGSPSSSPICMVLDAYLDNVIANVPQLALCLQERGVVQAVKLFDTLDLPKMSSNDLMSSDFSVQDRSSGMPVKPLFSQSVVDSNAALMLEFLKTNCSRENSTYLLTRNAGETRVQLLDVTSLSRQRHRKWIYWLAMISMRFAMQLDRLGKEHDCDESMKSEYRRKRRGLLENALELLHELADMGGSNHETLCSSIYEQLADSYLGKASCDDNVEAKNGSFECSFLQSGNVGIDNLVYNSVSVDCLSKASDLLRAGVKTLLPVLENLFENNNAGTNGVSVELEAISLQVYGLHHKLINISLSLANKYLVKYKSSSVMQSLRLCARAISDAASLFLRIVDLNTSEQFLGYERRDFVNSIAFQYSLLMENCGNFARSFAGDSAWRERGHVCGDDIIGLLRDVEMLSHSTNKMLSISSAFVQQNDKYCIVAKSKGVITLDYLSGLIPLSEEGDIVIDRTKSITTAYDYLDNQKPLKRDKRRVLVAACLKYGQAADIFDMFCSMSGSTQTRIWSILLQRLGDAYNEIGKVLLDDLRTVLQKDTRSKMIGPFLLSAEWWFKEGLEIFELCKDVRNVAFLRCNLSQCCKIRTNASSSRMNFKGRYDCSDKIVDSHAEQCLNDAARHLELAHEALDQRELHDPNVWDMVSVELAAIYLLLGVRRRQIIIGQVPSSVSPGEERAIITPIIRAKDIYVSLGIDHKVAAANYQLALYYAKVWMCQRDEALTKEKLSKAFSYFGQAHKYYFSHSTANEDILVCLLLDLCSLYSTTSSSYECQEKALLCCLDSCGAFSADSIEQARSRESTLSDWFSKMDSLNDKMEDRILNLLSSLVKKEKNDPTLIPKYEALYRSALQVKLGSQRERITQFGAYRVFEILNIIKASHAKQNI